MLDLQQLINNFMNYIKNNGTDIYNEFSFQHELGIFLRYQLAGKGYKVQFERNVRFFVPAVSKTATVKHEIDISIFNQNLSEKYAIELKYPTNKQYPEQMYAFIKDIKFAEELKTLGFTSTCVLTLADDPLFYTNGNSSGIYQFFRNQKQISGTVHKPTGQDKDSSVTLSGRYIVNWTALPVPQYRDRKYYCIVLR
ncbi:hypothetical protein J5690_03445 [bacterium]|nr:hypothetical protein [bacterium]